MHGLYRHLPACDLAVVQGGLTTSMELTANRRPFLYFPLRHHFEQTFHVRHRLERYGAGRAMDFELHGPEEIAAAIAAEISRPVNYRPVDPTGAKRAQGSSPSCSEYRACRRAASRSPCRSHSFSAAAVSRHRLPITLLPAATATVTVLRGTSGGRSRTARGTRHPAACTARPLQHEGSATPRVRANLTAPFQPAVPVPVPVPSVHPHPDRSLTVNDERR